MFCFIGLMRGKGSTFIPCKIFQKNSFGKQKSQPCSVDPITEETDEGEIILGEVLDCASNLTTDASFSPKVTQEHAAQNAELIEVVQKKNSRASLQEVQQVISFTAMKTNHNKELSVIKQ